MNTVNAAGGGSIDLEAGCTYSLIARDNNAFGGNGATIAGNSSNGLTITGGKVSGAMAAGAGAGILNVSGTLDIDSTLVAGNFANGATATLVKSDVELEHAAAAESSASRRH